MYRQKKHFQPWKDQYTSIQRTVNFQSALSPTNSKSTLPYYTPKIKLPNCTETKTFHYTYKVNKTLHLQSKQNTTLTK